jgi:D-glycero-D-manno-heptose 1,7-bisphosphate phosphatase
MNKAIFLDRDGVINSDEGLYYVYKPEEFRINPGVIQFLGEAHKRGYLLIIISNQGGIARGKYSKKDVEELHKLLQAECGKQGFSITELYFCPHHSEVNKCLCRKPGTLMIEKALARFQIDPARSYFVGDRETDEQVASITGLTPIRIIPNSDLLNYLPLIH